MAWQVGVGQTVCVECILDGEATDPTAPITAQIWLPDAGAWADLDAEAIEVLGHGQVEVALTGAQMQARGCIYIAGNNGAWGTLRWTNEEDWTATRAGRIDATISSRSSHTAANVAALLNNLSEAEVQAIIDALQTHGDSTWTTADVSALALEATLDELKGAGWSNETLKAIKDVVDSIFLASGDATATNQLTIIDHLTDIKGGTWSDETLVALAVLLEALPTAAEIDTKLTSSHGAGTWGGSAGTGSNECKYTFVDTNGDLLANVAITVKADVAGVAGDVVATLSTNSSGVLTCYLDDGTYHLINNSTGTHEGEDNTVTVDGDETATITITAVALPSPPSSDYCAVYGFPETITGEDGDGTARITHVWSPATSGTGASTKDITYGRKDVATISNGRWSLNILRGAVVDIKVDLTNGKTMERTRVTVPQTASVNWQQMVVAS